MDFKNILVAINGTKVDEETVPLACSLARKSKGKVLVTYVIQIDRTLPLDAEVKPSVDRAEEALSAAEIYAEASNCEINTDLLQARAIGPALVDEINEKHADLIILGIEYETRFGEFTMGNIAPYVLKNAPCQVLVWREKMPPKDSPLV